MGRYIKKTGQTTPVNAVVENTWSGSTVNAPSVAMVQDSLVGENLLINSDFRNGVINQKGATSYTTLNQYGIDMWLLRSNSTVKLDVQTGSVKISATTNMIQFVELESGEKYHLSAYFDNQLYELDFIAGSTTATENDYLTSYRDTEKQKQVIGIREGVEKTIQFIKLEKGSRFTGMPVWNEAEELLKCQRYLFSCYKISGYGFETGGGNVHIYVNIPTPMKKQGTIRVGSTLQVIGDGAYKTLTISGVNVSSQDNNLVILSGVISEAGNLNTVKIFELNNFTLDTYDY